MPGALTEQGAAARERRVKALAIPELGQRSGCENHEHVTGEERTAAMTISGSRSGSQGSICGSAARVTVGSWPRQTEITAPASCARGTRVVRSYWLPCSLRFIRFRSGALTPPR